MHIHSPLLQCRTPPYLLFLRSSRAWRFYTCKYIRRELISSDTTADDRWECCTHPDPLLEHSTARPTRGLLVLTFQ